MSKPSCTHCFFLLGSSDKLSLQLLVRVRVGLGLALGFAVAAASAHARTGRAAASSTWGCRFYVGLQPRVLYTGLLHCRSTVLRRHQGLSSPPLSAACSAPCAHASSGSSCCFMSGGILKAIWSSSGVPASLSPVTLSTSLPSASRSVSSTK